MQRARFLLLPLGLCALAAVGAHASADVLGDTILWGVDRADALFDSVFARWALTAPMVDWVGQSERVFFARGVALLWELAADALLLIPLIGYDERAPKAELNLARKLLRKLTPAAALRPLCTAAICIGGARAVAHLLRSALYRAPLIAHGLGALALLLLTVLFVSRAALRSMEYGQQRKPWLAVPGAVVLIPLAVAAFR